MTEAFLALIPDYGVWIIAAATFFSCLAVPAPASIMMIGGGAFAAVGDLSLIATATAALSGAITGDQTGYALGRRGANWLDRARTSKRGHQLNRAHTFFQKWGHPGVFFSRWLVSPLGPYVNFIAGASRLDWIRFSIWAIAGELIWVASYTGLGYLFSGEIQMAANIAGNASGFLAAAVLSLFLGGLLFRNKTKAKQ